MFHCIPLLGGGRRRVESVDGRHGSLSSVPDHVLRQSASLRELLLDVNRISELPRGLFRLTKLYHLSLSDNEINYLPPDIANLINLEELDISKNDITEIPENIRFLNNLIIADFSSNPLSKLPSSFPQLNNLTVLGLNDVSLSELPHDFGSLSKLTSLELRQNFLKELPLSFSQLHNLERLDLGSNEFEELQPLIGQLSSLQELWLDCNELTTLPPEIQHLKQLNCLDVSENRLETLPEEIGGLENLTDLHLSQNCLELLPDGIGKLQKLTIFKIDQNRLGYLNPVIGNDVNLQELILTENLLSELPPSIGHLTNLTNLNVDRNRLLELSLQIGNLTKLRVLSLRDNCLSYLPEEMGNLNDLRVLDVSGNRLQYLPITITALNLKAIWLAENQAQPMLKFQTDVDEKRGCKILTCFLLPQQAYLVESMENLLCNSAEKVNRLSWSLKSDKEKVTAVKFAEESDNEEKETQFIRHDTPHPKELKARHNKLFVQKGKNIDGHVLIPDDEKGDKSGVFRPQRSSIASENEEFSDNLDKSIQSNDDTEILCSFNMEEHLPVEDIKREEHPVFHCSAVASDSQITQEKSDSFSKDDAQYGKFDFNINKWAESNNKLSPREMAPHSKNSRLDQLYTKKDYKETSPLISPEKEEIDAKISDNLNDGENLNITDFDRETLTFEIEKHTKGLGLSIAGGKGTSPYKDNDQGIFVSRVTVGGVADLAGIKVGDKIVEVDGKSMVQASHYEAVERLKTMESHMVIKVSRKTETTTKTKDQDTSSVHKITLDESKENNTILDEHTEAKENFKQVESNDQKYETIKETIHTTLIREHNGLGFSIAGGQGSLPYKEDCENIYISRIADNGAAFKDGKLKVGDRVVSINGIDMEGARHDQAVSLLTDSERYVHLVVEREQLRPKSSNIVEKSSPLIAHRFSNSTNFYSSTSYMANRPSYLGTYKKLAQVSGTDTTSSPKLSHVNNKRSATCTTPPVERTEEEVSAPPSRPSDSVQSADEAHENRPVNSISSTTENAKKTTTTEEKDVQQPDA
ncbi:protein lap4-like isoform X2 [Centruroides vittatus]|uniref:protein lap4-like isoform X2 n=1 Tax=Centruroides vittatus TaxID=120091 RepID=UPI00350F2143